MKHKTQLIFEIVRKKEKAKFSSYIKASKGAHTHYLTSFK